MNTTNINRELSEYDRRLLIGEEVEHAIRNTQNNLFNYYPFPKSTLIAASSVGPEAHLAIEKSMKFLLKALGKEPGCEHGLDKLLGLMSETTTTFLNKEGINTEFRIKEFLKKAFLEAIGFYQIDPNKKDMCHTKSLEKYLCETGNCKFFQFIRYWHTDKPDENEVEKVIKLIPAIHLELLYAMYELLEPHHYAPWTVNDRVEVSVMRETTESGRADRLQYDENPDCAAREFMRWIRRQGTRRDAMAAAIKRDFQISDHPEINELMRTGCENLKKLDDPAVRFFIAQAEGQ